MARSQSAHPRASLPKQFANFTNSSAGLDLTLRLIQALVQMVAEAGIDNAIVMRCLVAKEQLALGRRYLRFFSFIDCFGRSYDLMAGTSPSAGTVSTMMELVQSSCLGVYILMEDLTMLHDMNVYLVPWYTRVLLEANKFWFCAICVSIAGTLMQLFSGSAAQSKTQKAHPDTDEKKKEEESERPPPSEREVSLTTASLLTRVVVDGCDLTLPASCLGWIGLGDSGVGMAMVVSTIIASRDVWARAQL